MHRTASRPRSMMVVLVAGLVAIAVTAVVFLVKNNVGGSSGKQLDTATKDRIYLQVARNYDTAFSDEYLIATGHAICVEFQQGERWIDVLASTVASKEWSAYASGALIADAVGIYCPKYLSALPPPS